MQISKKRVLLRIKQSNNDEQNKKTIKDLGGEYTLKHKTITATDKIDKLHSDWSGYCDELDPY